MYQILGYFLEHVKNCRNNQYNKKITLRSKNDYFVSDSSKHFKTNLIFLSSNK